MGWDPRRAVLVRPPSGLTTRTLADLLRRLQSGATLSELQDQADEATAESIADLVASLVDAGLVTTTTRRRGRAASIRIHGQGPLSDLLLTALRCSGARVTQSSRTHAGAAAEPTDLAVLTDFLVCDPRVVRELHAAGVPHLPVRVRDGAGLVGPWSSPA